jgi:hypothetical protein
MILNKNNIVTTRNLILRARSNSDLIVNSSLTKENISLFYMIRKKIFYTVLNCIIKY